MAGPLSKPHELKLDAYQSGGEAIVLLKGRLVLENCEVIRKRLADLLAPQLDKLFIHMGGLDYVDSAGWGVLVGLKMAANRNRTRLSFLSPTDRVKDIFRISKLDTIFEVFEGSEAELIRSALQKRDHLLWRDSRDENESLFSTDSSTLTPAPRDAADGAAPADAERREEVRRLCRDAVEHLKHGQYDKVVEAYRRVLEIEPEDLAALNNLAVVLEKRQEWQSEAVETWKQVMALSQKRQDPKHVERARRHLQSLQASAGD